MFIYIRVYSTFRKKPSSGGGVLAANVIWGKKYENGREKNGENEKEKGRKRKETGYIKVKRIKLIKKGQKMKKG
jgi:hypothetical protein